MPTASLMPMNVFFFRFLLLANLKPKLRKTIVLWLLSIWTVTASAQSFINFETAHVHPLDLSPNGNLLASCNTDANSIELFETRFGSLVHIGAIPVGFNPVSVRFRNDNELWVVNHISDTVSVIDIETSSIIRTLQTDDEPADVIFAGTPEQAYVSCSQANTVLVFDTANLNTAPTSISIEGEDPRALAKSPDGMSVYVAIFESGNASTILGGGIDDTSTLSFPPNVVGISMGPYGGTNPPPNSGTGFNPPLNPTNPSAPRVGLIVKKKEDKWMDDNNGNWTNLVSGANAARSGRPVGWELIDNDIAIINTTDSSVQYITGLMNICMGIAINPASGDISIVGTDATNEIRFEPILNGRFLRVNIGTASPTDSNVKSVVDLNPHLDYASSIIPQSERDKSLGDPRGIAWTNDGEIGYVTGKGSNNIIIIDSTGKRIENTHTIETREGPTGIAINENQSRLYALNRFDGSISVIDTVSNKNIHRVTYYDPTPDSITKGRRHLYDTHETSGLGHVSCASCHVDSRMDRLSWDLGDPSGNMKSLAGRHKLLEEIQDAEDLAEYTDYHPMKGPMLTQTLQDIIGKEPHHWRGDRDGLEDFNGAFKSLLGDDKLLTSEEMQEFEDFLATIYYPPNPFRNTDNSLPTDLPLPGHFASGRFSPAGTPLPNGNAQSALVEYRSSDRSIDRGDLSCVICHSLPTGMSPEARYSLSLDDFIDDLPRGPNGERHHAIVQVDGLTQKAFKVAQLRNLYDRVGFETTNETSRSGFGFLHDGSVDSIARFISTGAFEMQDDQEVADFVALMLSFSGSGFAESSDPRDPPGTESNDAHAAIGKQILSIDSSNTSKLDELLDLSETGAFQVVAKSSIQGESRGWFYQENGIFISDQASIEESLETILGRATSSTPVTFTVVPNGSGVQYGIDRDLDGILNYDEIRDLIPEIAGVQNPFNPSISDSTGNSGITNPDQAIDGDNDFDGDGQSNSQEIVAGTNPLDNILDSNPSLGLKITREADNTALIEWMPSPLAEYEVLFSTDLVVWIQFGSAPIKANAEGTRMSWLDIGPPQTDSRINTVQKRFYRVNRVE